MFLKLKKTISALLLFFIMPCSILAYSDYIIASGENIGIELNAKGVLIIGTYEVENNDLAKQSGLQIGDMITKVGNTPVTTVDDMVSKINDQVQNNEVNITYLRNEQIKNTTLKLYKSNDVYKTGLYVKDHIIGIGTLTFIDPNTKLYGALGHEIIEKSTGQILEIKDGKIFDSTVTGVDSSSNGTPGEKNASYDKTKVQGDVKENTTQGIFGTYQEEIHGDLYKVATPSEIKEGKAYIYTVTDGNIPEKYEINITKINQRKQKNKNFVFEITDENLLTRTGGIVQGMSGSPIIQDDKIIGAVTHVVVDNPKKGYGIFITNMLEEAEN